MALNFPSNPSTNDTYSFGGKTWVYTGSAWKQTGANAANITTTGNVTAGNILSDNYFYANGDPFTSYTNTDVETLLSGNITVGNVTVTGVIDGYATTTYVNTEVANLVNAAPSTLDTLNELATALGNDAAFSTTITALIGNNASNITTIQSQITALEANTHANLESNVTTLESDVTTLQGNVTTLESNVTTLQGNVTTLESDVTALQANTHANLESNVTTLESDVTTLQSNVTTLEGNITTLESQVYNDSNVATFLSDIGSNNISTTGDITANSFIGNGSQLTGIQAGANVTFSNSAPLSPSEGDVWIDSNIGVQLIYIDDGDSGQWVDFQSTVKNYGSSNYGDSNVLSYLGNISGNLVPSANVTYDLGSTTNRWNTLYLAGNTIDLGGAQIKSDPDAGTIALIPQIKSGETTTKAIVIGSSGISTIDTDTDGNVSAANIAAAATSANTSTGNIEATGVTITNSLTVNTTAVISGNITAGNILTDNYLYANGSAFTSYTNSDVDNYLPTYTGNITAGNILSDNYFYANGEVFVSGGDTLASLTDVDLTTAAPTDDQVLTWSSSTNKWIPTDKISPVVVTWNTPSGSLGTFGDISRENFSYTLSASASVGDLTYSIVTGSLPTGLSLNGNTGVISGNASSVAQETTSTFTVRATSVDDGNASNREFSITLNAPGVQVFAYTGADQTFTVPAGVTKILVKMWGAGGGGNGSSLAGGAGGAVLGYRDVSAAQSYVIRVGGGGSYSCGGQCSGSSSTGGFGGGAGSYEGNGGGGGSFIFYGGTNHTNLIAVAGGGGGGGGGTGGAGGAGGGNVGQNTLYSGGPSGNQGTGGTQVSGYAQFNGGAASGNGGGGGGGYYGGYGGYRAGSWIHVSGGGGSGYIGGLSNSTNYQGNGLTPGNDGDSDRAGAAAQGTAGRVVIRW